jgi:hypothetical protein
MGERGNQRRHGCMISSEMIPIESAVRLVLQLPTPPDAIPG